MSHNSHFQICLLLRCQSGNFLSPLSFLCFLPCSYIAWNVFPQSYGKSLSSLHSNSSKNTLLSMNHKTKAFSITLIFCISIYLQNITKIVIIARKPKFGPVSEPHRMFSSILSSCSFPSFLIDITAAIMKLKPLKICTTSIWGFEDVHRLFISLLSSCFFKTPEQFQGAGKNMHWGKTQFNSVCLPYNPL